MSKQTNSAPVAGATTAPSQEGTQSSGAVPAGTTSPPTKFVPKVLKVITLPLLKLRPGSELFVKIVDKMYQADQQKNAKPDKDGKLPNPPMLVNVVNLETGELCQIIPGTILQDIFTDKYPNATYVNKGFWIKVGEKKGGGGGRSSYNTYTVSEIEVPA